jgi:hypothetical protein
MAAPTFKLPSAPDVDKVVKSVEKLKKAHEASLAMEKARKSLGMMTKEEERAVKEKEKHVKATQALAKANASIDFEPVTRPIEAFQKALSAAGPEAQAAAAAATMYAAALGILGAALAKTISFVVLLVGELQVLRAQWMALAKGGAGAGMATLAAVDALAARLPFAVDQVREWGKGLMMAKLTGRDLENGIKAVAGAAALMGDSGAAAAQRLIETLARGGFEAAALVAKIKLGSNEAQVMLNEMGLRLSDVAKVLGTTVKGMQRMRLSARQMAEAVEKALAIKAAGPLGEMMLTWPVLIGKLKEGFMSLFGKLGPAVKPFMKAVSKLFGDFGKGTPLMKKLQGIVTAVFTTIFAWGTKAVGVVRGFLKSLTSTGKSSGMMKTLGDIFNHIVVSARMVWNTMKGVAGIFKIFIGNKNGMKTIEVAFKIIVAVVGFFIKTFIRLAAVTFMVIGAFVAFVGMIIGGVLSAIGFIIGLGEQAIDALSDFADSAYDAAANFVSGLVTGIVANAGSVISAVTNLASSALSAFKSVLGIASPSKVMMQMGEHTAAGTAQGIDQGTSKVEASAANMGASAAGAAAGAMGGAGKGGKGGGGVQVKIEAGAIVIHGAATINEETLASVLERLLMAQGLGAR